MIDNINTRYEARDKDINNHFKREKKRYRASRFFFIDFYDRKIILDSKKFPHIEKSLFYRNFVKRNTRLNERRIVFD